MSVRIVTQMVLCAAVLVVLLGTGMRPGELLGLLGGRTLRSQASGETCSDAGWLPRCVSEAASKSGFSIAMLVHGHVFKQRARPQAVSWLLALRQIDEADPWVLHALRTIERLSGILRPFAPEEAREMLVLDFGGRGYDKLVVDRVHTGKLAYMMRAAIPRFADLASIEGREEAGRSLAPYRETNGGCIALYQCRKTYAQTLFAISPNLLIPISRQYQHASPDGTYSSYVTGDPTFWRELEPYRARRTAYLVDEALEGEEITRNTMASTIDRVIERSAAVPDASIRDEFWAERLKVEGALFEPGRLRPSAGAVSVMRAAAARSSGEAPATMDLGRIGPSVLRTWITQRRRVEEADATGAPAAGRPARELAREAARRLAMAGYQVPARLDEATGGEM